MHGVYDPQCVMIYNNVMQTSKRACAKRPEPKLHIQRVVHYIKAVGGKQ